MLRTIEDILHGELTESATNSTEDILHAELTESATNSTVKVSKVTHKWTIDNFDFCEAEGSDIISPEFSAYVNDDVKWYLKLKPNGQNDGKDKDTIGLYLHLSEKSKCKTILAKFLFSILNNGQEKYSLSTKEVCKFVSYGGWPIFCKKDENFRKNLLSNNVLKISCEITFSKGSSIIKHESYRNTPFLMSTLADRNVTGILNVLHETHLLSDVVISVQSKEYPAHKAILAARSKVFAAMFEHDTKENQMNRVEIEDMSEETVDELLRFIYTERCKKLKEFAKGLLAAADKYDLDLLKAICTEALCDNLSIENAAQVLILADMHNANDLKNQVINFIVSKPNEVFSTGDWHSVVGYPRLLDEVCRAMARR